MPAAAGIFLLSGLRCLLTAGYEQRVDNKQYGAHGNGGIGNIECREPLATDQEAEIIRHLDEIDDVAEADTIDNIAERTTEDQRQTTRKDSLARRPQSPQPDGDDGAHRNGQRNKKPPLPATRVGKETESSTGIAPMSQLQE